MRRTRTLASVFATLTVSGLVVTGCATKIAVRSLRPGPVPIGGARHLAILDGEGRRSAREVVYQEFVGQCRTRGYFTAVDRTEEGLEVRVAGRRVELAGRDLEPTEAGVRIDVLEWNTHRDSEEVVRKDDKGQEYVEVVRFKKAEVLLAVTLFNPAGRALLAEKEYGGGFATRDMEVPPEEILEHAARAAVSRVLDDITPVEVVTWVRLDDDDPGQEFIIETAKSGNIAQAADDARAYLEASPRNAAAAYNLAVFLEAMGEYAEALESYDLALSLGNKRFYTQARAGCARRLAAASALSEEPEPARRGVAAEQHTDDDEPAE